MFLKFLCYLGVFLTALGLILIALGMLKILNLETFSYGISSGIRVLASISILGCLISAIGFKLIEFKNHQ